MLHPTHPELRVPQGSIYQAKLSGAVIGGVRRLWAAEVIGGGRRVGAAALGVKIALWYPLTLGNYSLNYCKML
jgi:hypothetical protein